MNDLKARVDALTTSLSAIKDILVKNECGEIYLTWKGGSVDVKFNQWIVRRGIREDIDLTKEQK